MTLGCDNTKLNPSLQVYWDDSIWAHFNWDNTPEEDSCSKPWGSAGVALSIQKPYGNKGVWYSNIRIMILMCTNSYTSGVYLFQLLEFK